MFDLKNIQEDITTEFKAKLNGTLEREVVAFLNSKKGGDIYIGISDDKKVIGVEDVDAVQLVISDRLKNNIEPSSLFTEDLRDSEDAKISCARKHFKEISDKTEYVISNGFEHFREMV